MGSDGGLAGASAIEDKYAREFERSINPFTEWEQGEIERAHGSLWIPERALLAGAKWLLPVRVRRLALLVAVSMLLVVSARCVLGTAAPMAPGGVELQAGLDAGT